MTRPNTRAENAWAISMLLGAIAILTCVVALILGLLVGKDAGFVTLWVAVGLAVLSAIPAPIFLRAWR